jgi:uncharacterized protein (DUF305 family)
MVPERSHNVTNADGDTAVTSVAPGHGGDGGVTNIPTAAHRSRRLIAVALVALFVLAGVFAAGRLTAPRVGTPSNVSAEAGFARDMQTHHNQAVEMAFIIRDATDDAEIRLVAYDIATSQASQGGQLYGYLTEWNLPQASPEPAMTWMTRPSLAGLEHTHTAAAAGSSAHTPGDPMPGLATAEQMAELSSLTGVEAERMFLTLMIAHHKGGIEMAEALLERSDYPSVTALARGVITVQTTEISVMEAMLADRS